MTNMEEHTAPDWHANNGREPMMSQTTHTPGAMRAATGLIKILAPYMGLSLNNPKLVPVRNTAAEIIDRETAAPQLLEACRLAASDCQQLLDNWENGDLAGAVRGLNETVKMLRGLIEKATNERA